MRFRDFMLISSLSAGVFMMVLVWSAVLGYSVRQALTQLTGSEVIAANIIGVLWILFGSIYLAIAAFNIGFIWGSKLRAFSSSGVSCNSQ